MRSSRRGVFPLGVLVSLSPKALANGILHKGNSAKNAAALSDGVIVTPLSPLMGIAATADRN